VNDEVLFNSLQVILLAAILAEVTVLAAIFAPVIVALAISAQVTCQSTI
jgi:hypothetical protein